MSYDPELPQRTRMTFESTLDDLDAYRATRAAFMALHRVWCDHYRDDGCHEYLEAAIDRVRDQAFRCALADRRRLYGVRSAVAA